MGSAREKIEGMPMIKAFHRGSLFAALFRNDLERWFAALRRGFLYRELARAALFHVPRFLAVGLLVGGGVLVLRGQISLGTVVAFFWHLEGL
ncbi:MAG: ABC transporter transmembrane domain-containing protein [Thermofilaceae archaeon]